MFLELRAVRKVGIIFEAEELESGRRNLEYLQEELDAVCVEVLRD